MIGAAGNGSQLESYAVDRGVPETGRRECPEGANGPASCELSTGCPSASRARVLEKPIVRASRPQHRAAVLCFARSRRHAARRNPHGPPPRPRLPPLEALGGGPRKLAINAAQGRASETLHRSRTLSRMLSAVSGPRNQLCRTPILGIKNRPARAAFCCRRFPALDGVESGARRSPPSRVGSGRSDDHSMICTILRVFGSTRTVLSLTTV